MLLNRYTIQEFFQKDLYEHYHRKAHICHCWKSIQCDDEMLNYVASLVNQGTTIDYSQVLPMVLIAQFNITRVKNLEIFCEYHDDVLKWKHFSRYWSFVMGNYRWIRLTTASDAELRHFLWSAHEQTIEQTIETLMIWDAIALIMTSR